MTPPNAPRSNALPPQEARLLRRRILHGAAGGPVPFDRARHEAKMRAAGGKARRRLRALEPSWMRQLFPDIANSAAVEAWQEHGPQQVFRISPWLTRVVALWSLLSFFATDYPVRAATLYWDGVANGTWDLPRTGPPPATPPRPIRARLPA